MILSSEKRREPPGGRIRLDWDSATQRLIEPGAVYGRMTHLPRGGLLCAYEKAGACWIRISSDEGHSWSPATLVARCEYGGAANPELLCLSSGAALLFFNIRPGDGKHPFVISCTASQDAGRTWTTRPTPIFEADSDPRNGCWEPAAVQLSTGEIQLFFANESPYRSSDEQEISVCRSFDDGRSWSAPTMACFRAGHRDGMPVPILLQEKGQETIMVSIEDNGLAPGALLQPAVFRNLARDSWRKPVLADSPLRQGAIRPALPPNIYAGAPYLCRLPTGETLLSCHSTQDRPGGKPRMVVYIGKRDATDFTNRSVPFEIPETVSGMWNSLFIRNADTVTALSSTAINGIFGLWAINARVLRK